nr:uncharacterized protein LOC112286844 [Physcomitrium patens]|eukprot:XP_024384927.1 uncharacterized protein LOC112286844 [Physcomitrella patens]
MSNCRNRRPSHGASRNTQTLTLTSPPPPPPPIESDERGEVVGTHGSHPRERSSWDEEDEEDDDEDEEDDDEDEEDDDEDEEDDDEDEEDDDEDDEDEARRVLIFVFDSIATAWWRFDRSRTPPSSVGRRERGRRKRR